jgi:16S rRNA (guanine527-N7)-methyltransferase
MSSIIGKTVAEETAALQLKLSPAEINSFESYAAELIKWNRKINLTAITGEKEIAIKHFVDSLSLAPFISAEDRLLDMGSGAGLPVLPLKIIMPATAMVSVDAVAKKIHFQRHIIRTLELQNIEAVHSRIEELHTSHRHGFTVITSRAFTRLDRFVALAAPLLAEDGVLIAMKGEQADDEISASDADVSGSGFVVTSLHRYSLPFGMGKRVLTFLKRCEAA